MPGVVVGVNRAATSSGLTAWAAEEARRRGLPLTLVHAWPEDVDLDVALTAEDLPGLDGPAESHAVHGRAAAALLAHRPDLLVLGGHAGSPRLRHVTRLCLGHAGCAVVVVPDCEPTAFRRVVVGVDATDTSRAALLWAADTARMRAARLSVIHAWQPHPWSPGELLHPGRHEPVQQVTEDTALHGWVGDVLGHRLPDETEIRAVRGAPLDTLLSQAAMSDLVVVGRRTHHGIGRILHGAVATSLGALAPCPVAVVPAGAEPVRVVQPAGRA